MGDSRYNGLAADRPHTFHMGELLHEAKQLEEMNKEHQGWKAFLRHTKNSFMLCP